MVDEFVILVDGNDRPIGTEEKTRCHLPDGRLHRAFTALLFDAGGRLVLARRARGKMLWPGDWDGTFASHPREGETYVSAGQRRMPEELGIGGSLEYVNKFEYHARYRDVGSENEICATLVGTVGQEISPVPGEIDEVRAVSAAELLEEVEAEPGSYCPWMLIALELLGGPAAAGHGGIPAQWTAPGARAAFGRAIDAHIARKEWRLVDG